MEESMQACIVRACRKRASLETGILSGLSEPPEDLLFRDPAKRALSSFAEKANWSPVRLIQPVLHLKVRIHDMQQIHENCSLYPLRASGSAETGAESLSKR